MSLIVPIRDRRQRRRVLTLKNFGRVLLGLAIFFAGLTIESNLRHPKPDSDYGRLFGKQVSGHTAVEPKKPDMIVAPIEDQTAADPLLVGAAAREQYLRVETTTTADVPQTNASAVAGPNGVAIVRSASPIDQRHPTLSGGIFRP